MAPIAFLFWFISQHNKRVHPRRAVCAVGYNDLLCGSNNVAFSTIARFAESLEIFKRCEAALRIRMDMVNDKKHFTIA